MSTERQRLLPWLIDQINSGEIPGLEWLDAEKTLFKIPWKHIGKPGFNIEKHAALFRKWALHTDKYQAGGQEDPSTWKTRFRCALYKLPDLEEVKTGKDDTEEEPFRTYRLKDRGNLDTNNNSSAPTASCSPTFIQTKPDITDFSQHEYLSDLLLDPRFGLSEEGMDWDACVTESSSDNEHSSGPSSVVSEDLQEILRENGHCEAFEETCHMGITLPLDLESIILDPLLPLTRIVPSAQHAPNYPVQTMVHSQSIQPRLQTGDFMSQLNQTTVPVLDSISTQAAQASSSEQHTNPRPLPALDTLLMKKKGIKVKVYYLTQKVKEDDITAPVCRYFSGNGLNKITNGAPLCNEAKHHVNKIYGDSEAQQIQLPCYQEPNSLLYQLLKEYFVRGILIEQTDTDIYVTRLSQSRAYWNYNDSSPVKLEREMKTRVFSYTAFQEQCLLFSAGQVASRPSADVFISVARNYNGSPHNVPLITLAITHAQASQDLAIFPAVMTPENFYSYPNTNDQVAIQAEFL